MIMQAIVLSLIYYVFGIFVVLTFDMFFKRSLTMGNVVLLALAWPIWVVLVVGQLLLYVPLFAIQRVRELNPSKRVSPPKHPRNSPCYCGSGVKYKKCHGKS
jgi:hypothetical protein